MVFHFVSIICLWFKSYVVKIEKNRDNVCKQIIYKLCIFSKVIMVLLKLSCIENKHSDELYQNVVAGRSLHGVSKNQPVSVCISPKLIELIRQKKFMIILHIPIHNFMHFSRSFT